MDRDPIVLISVTRLDKSWKCDGGLYIRKHARGNGSASRAKYKRFGCWFRDALPVQMPHIGISEGHVSFTNGRHRFAWLRDHGVRALPVTVTRENLAEIRRRFGIKRREI